MNNKPLVSILSPCYNVEQFLPQCIDSIVNQTYKNLQIVLIDDGSKDGTWRIMQEYAARYSRIEVYHQENQGVASTRNHLLEKVKGDYVLFVDSDDWCEQSMVEFLVGKALTNEADIVVCGMVKNDDVCSEEYFEVKMDREDTVRKFLFHKELSGSLCNKLVKTSLLHGIRFDNRISYGEDALFCWGLIQYVNKVLLTNKALYHYRMNMDSISHQSFGSKKLTGHEVWRIINKECEIMWPQYLDIAQARWGMEDMYLLRQAGQCNFKKNDAIRQIQETVKRFIPQMKATGLLEGKEILNANIMCRWYEYNILYNVLHKLFRR